jgi:hypothetical protein
MNIVKLGLKFFKPLLDHGLNFILNFNTFFKSV